MMLTCTFGIEHMHRFLLILTDGIYTHTEEDFMVCEHGALVSV